MFRFNVPLAVISAGVVVLTAGYILWAIQRVYLGAEYRGPHEEALVPATLRENTIAGILLALAILFGVQPYYTVLQYMDDTVVRQVNDLKDWTVRTESEREEPEEMAIQTNSQDHVAPAPIQANVDNELSTTPTAVVRPNNRSSID